METHASRRNLKRELRYLFIAGVVFKLLLLFFEQTKTFDPRFYIHNDSGSYVSGSYEFGAMTWGRPMGYPLFMRVLWMFLGKMDFNALVIVQTILGTVIPCSIYWILRSVYKFGRTGSVLFAVVSLISPMNLILEHYILAETLTLVLLALTMCLFIYQLDHYKPRNAILLGVLIALVPLCRACWIYLPPLLIGLFIVYHFVIHRRTFMRPLLALVLITAAFLVPYKGYGLWYSYKMTRSFKYYNQGPVSVGGIALWSKVAEFAKPEDLAGFEWKNDLFANATSLKNGMNYQYWDNNSTANKLILKIGKRPVSDAALSKAAWMVIRKHPREFLYSMGKMTPIIFTNRMPENICVRISPLAYNEQYFKMFAQMDLTTMRDRLVGKIYFLDPFYRWWQNSRKYFLGAIFLGLILSLFNLKKKSNFVTFTVSSLAMMNFMILFLGADFFDRYFQPLEYLGLISFAGIIAFLKEAISSRLAKAAAPAGEPQVAPEEAVARELAAPGQGQA